ncbi:GNAT family N-acetyltransferase [Paracrocinitomix mangrovi]|uniref:GNAT family N-acetyltransferase n=1 Tax=Paracrocinitomix mangrovi TaxID=2862509 RepID=UPI001C8EF4BD|nr:GNAT family N-acetyltransferase [Paracrocinitomix mangrovi]UKN01395.1 GNAT family N-acetyltransferase [Paracrocinitomix mangrovi]
MQFSFVSHSSGLHPIFTNQKIADFLFEHLDQYGDQHEDIMRCLDYAVNDQSEGKGFVMVGHEGEDIVACTVINETGMSGYIPENILVYIAVHKKHRGKGLGKQLMEHAIKLCKGDVALHVEKENPARFLYEKLGFTNPYLEMRLKR